MTERKRWQHEEVNLFSCDAEFEFGQVVKTFPGGYPLHLTLKQNTPAFPFDLNRILIWGSFSASEYYLDTQMVTESFVKRS